MTSELENYIVKCRIGRGQFGKVFEVEDKRDGYIYALKTIYVQGNQSIETCLKEAQVLAAIPTHVNIVRYYHCWIGPTSPEVSNADMESEEDDGFSTLQGSSSAGTLSETLPGMFLFIKTELCEMNLRKWMNDHLKTHTNGKGIKSVLDFFVQVSLAVKFIHNNKYVHRDLKPENIFVVKYGRDDWKIKIGDFGIVYKNIPNHTGVSGRVSNPGGIYGTQPYAAPEMLKGEEFDHKADVYSMAVIFLELLYPMSTVMEITQVLETLIGNAQPSSEPLKIFQKQHSNEILKIKEMLAESELRPTSKNFHYWLKSFRKKENLSCTCHT